MDYMDQPHELEKHPGERDIFKTVCNGNLDALALVWYYWNFAEALDDLVDKDKECNRELMTKALSMFLLQLVNNTFFLANKESLMTMILNSLNRWLDGDKMEMSIDAIKAQQGKVVTAGGFDFLMHIALICGGWDHMRDCSSKFRNY